MFYLIFVVNMSCRVDKATKQRNEPSCTRDTKMTENEMLSGSSKYRRSSPNDAGRKNKRSRKEVLASISANARKAISIPIPTFHTAANKISMKSSSNGSLDQLEREFLSDDDSNSDPDDNTSSCPKFDGTKLIQGEELKVRKEQSAATVSNPATDSDIDTSNIVIELLDDDDNDKAFDEFLFSSKKAFCGKRTIKESSISASRKNETMGNDQAKNVMLNKLENLKECHQEHTKKNEMATCSISDNVINGGASAGTSFETVDLCNHSNEKLKSSNASKGQLDVVGKSLHQSVNQKPCSSKAELDIDLQDEVRKLFQKSDVNEITVGSFMKALNKQMGIVLDKESRAEVKKQLKKLVEGDDSFKQNDTTTNTARDKESLNQSGLQIRNQAPTSNTVEDLLAMAKTNINDTSSPQIAKSKKDADNAVAVVPVATETDRPSINTVDKDAPIKSKEEVEVVETKSKAKPKTKRGGRKRNTGDKISGQEGIQHGAVLDSFRAEAVLPSAPAPNPPKKRARKKACCALCKTCPCQKGTSPDNASNLDAAIFSRSDAAIEKALIRRLQKLEKSTESLEEQTEMVRRRLKKHRRDIWTDVLELTRGKTARVVGNLQRCWCSLRGCPWRTTGICRRTRSVSSTRSTPSRPAWSSRQPWLQPPLSGRCPDCGPFAGRLLGRHHPHGTLHQDRVSHNGRHTIW